MLQQTSGIAHGGSTLSLRQAVRQEIALMRQGIHVQHAVQAELATSGPCRCPYLGGGGGGAAVDGDGLQGMSGRGIVGRSPACDDEHTAYGRCIDALQALLHCMLGGGSHQQQPHT